MNQPTTPNTAHTASIDSPEFLGRVIAAASEAMSIGPGKEWESFIAHINARLAPAAPSEIEAAIELPTMPDPEYQDYGRWFDQDNMQAYATEAVLKDRANRKGTK